MTADNDAHVIDDDEAVRKSIEFLLRSADLKVKTYDFAAAFLEVAPTIGSGCIITDVRMPGLSGSICCDASRTCKFDCPSS